MFIPFCLCYNNVLGSSIIPMNLLHLFFHLKILNSNFIDMYHVLIRLLSCILPPTISKTELSQVHSIQELLLNPNISFSFLDLAFKHLD